MGAPAQALVLLEGGSQIKVRIDRGCSRSAWICLSSRMGPWHAHPRTWNLLVPGSQPSNFFFYLDHSFLRISSPSTPPGPCLKEVDILSGSSWSSSSTGQMEYRMTNLAYGQEPPVPFLFFFFLASLCSQKSPVLSPTLECKTQCSRNMNQYLVWARTRRRLGSRRSRRTWTNSRGKW